MKLLNRIFITKNREMQIEKSSKFQWIKGDHIGTVEIVKSIEKNKIHFESGRLLIKEVFSEFMKAIKSDNDLLVIQNLNLEESNKNIDKKESLNSINEIKEKEDNFKISNSKIIDAINSSKKSKVLQLKPKIKYLDDSLYKFLKNANNDFDKLYKDLIINKVKEELEKEIDEFLNNIYNKD